MIDSPHTFAPLDTVRNLNTGTERIVRKVNPSIHGSDMLLVRSVESEENSILWTWSANKCELVSAAPIFNVHDHVTLGTGTVVREIKDTRIHDKTGEMQYRVDVDGEKEKWVIAAALHHVVPDTAPTPSVPAQVAAFEKHQFSTLNLRVGSGQNNSGIWHRAITIARAMYEANLWDPACELVINEVDDVHTRLFGVNPQPLYMLKQGVDYTIGVSDFPAEMQPVAVAYDLSATDAAADTESDPLFRAAQLLADEMDKTRAAEERAKVAELQIKKLEQIIHNRESYATQPQPVTVAQTECIETTTLWQDLAVSEQAKAADAELSTYRTNGWTLVHTMYAADLNKRALIMERTFKTPSQPTIGSAGHHASLTADYVNNERRSPFRSPTPADEIPAVGTLVVESAIKLGPIGTSIKEIGVEATSQLMNDFALQDAFTKAAQRIDKIPVFNRPLHSLKASN